MKEIKVTLIGDGSSDKALIYVIKWLLDDLYPKIPNTIQFADFRRFKTPPPIGDIKAKIKVAEEYYPFDILCYHRDAESNYFEIVMTRKTEILSQFNEEDNKIVCVVPVKMMETWLLISSDAIKKAAGNRNYQGNINLPKISLLEKQTQPKELLHKLLCEATGLKGRRLKSFNVHRGVHLIAEAIYDYSCLRNLAAFQEFENDIKEMLDDILSK